MSNQPWTMTDEPPRQVFVDANPAVGVALLIIHLALLEDLHDRIGNAIHSLKLSLYGSTDPVVMDKMVRERCNEKLGR